ncbi:uncharacterized protein MELLADRAFT_124203 [Melampsora larici-populina 98AG31]|uniref:Secreted protein n=1 Tax=Melampsora larici-populina (strain 98AG31 / pathotype 3-4-7) TaxID=747676 RepID=F4S6E1_MELLP|nr:uncharacterized protein MELLADRAFT_124203 [Melampsora larici-populina 98AG31]EGF99811.1 secreted protein [Melampsora larici-populina 98AG31]
MRKPSKLRLKDIFILWIITHVNLCVKGYPLFEKVTGYVKSLAATAWGDNVNNGVCVAKAVSDHIPDVGISAALRKTGAGDEKILGTKHFKGSGQTLNHNAVSPEPNEASDKDKFGNPATKDVKDETRPKTEDTVENLLKSTSKSEQTKALEASALSKLEPVFERAHIKPYGETMEFLNRDHVEKLSNDALIRYMAEKDTQIQKMAIDFQEAAQAHKEAEAKAFTVASTLYRQRGIDDVDIPKWIENKFVEMKQSPDYKGVSDQHLIILVRRSFIEQEANLFKTKEKLNKAQEASLNEETFTKFTHTKKQYNRAYINIRDAAKNLVSKDSLTPEALSKLTPKEYVKKASFFDKEVYKKYVQWKTEERLMRVAVNTFFPKVAKKFKTGQCEKEFDEEWANTIKGLQADVKFRGGPSDLETIEQASKRQFIKKQANHYPNDIKLKQPEDKIQLFEKNIENLMKDALRGANIVFKRDPVSRGSKPLGFAAIKIKNTGWLFIKFFKKMLNWFLKFGRKSSQGN